MLKCYCIDNIFAMFGGLFFQQTVGILMGTNCALRFADLFLYSCETDFIQGFRNSCVEGREVKCLNAIA
jgi:hypothetical protein